MTPEIMNQINKIIDRENNNLAVKYQLKWDWDYDNDIFHFYNAAGLTVSISENEHYTKFQGDIYELTPLLLSAVRSVVGKVLQLLK